MYMYGFVLLIIVVVIVVIIIVFFVNVKDDDEVMFNADPVLFFDEEPVVYYDDEGAAPNNDLYEFERHYLETLQEKHKQRADRAAVLRQFSDDDNIFVGLEPWTNAAHFGTLLHSLIAYGVRLRTAGDALFANEELAYRLYDALHVVFYRLPMPPPDNQTPWGSGAHDWRHFSVALPECFQSTCIVLRDLYDVSELTEALLRHYLPLPTFSLGRWRGGAAAVRMCLPYVYGQLLRGRSIAEIGREPQVRSVLQLVGCGLVRSGDGIRYDKAHVERGDVRSYAGFIDNYFTLSYYNFLFGADTVNMANANAALQLMGSAQGIAHPALLSHEAAHCAPTLAHLVDYGDGVHSADFSKILTMRTRRYFGSVVGQAPDFAYYDADADNRAHAPLWTMTRKIWANAARVLPNRAAGLESGVLLTDSLNGIVSVPGTGALYASVADTALATTENAGAMVMHARFDELGLELHSYTLYHRYGMFHLYTGVKSLRLLTNNARCVVLVRDTTAEPEWTGAGNVKSANGVTAKQHNILDSAPLSDFEVRTFDKLQLQTLEQVIGADLMNRGIGTACFSLIVQDVFEHDNTTVRRVPDTGAFLISTNSNSIRCVVDFPMVAMRDDEAGQVTVNDATSVSRSVHRLAVARIEAVLAPLELTLADVAAAAGVTRVNDFFHLENKHGNQFRFTFKQPQPL
ncbi:odv-e66 [Peridroma alphabaculovirus]|uniref:Odv-e66 n=1 Tax=Peridroma alphabaculovirus TaxID=1346829 RepID=A0A068LKJ7_9ABAC|nr:odv-e66 [Peridroma alphabaculovirus]AIE47817.1 odv-e66 [Peridroma alphabaculovirus]